MSEENWEDIFRKKLDGQQQPDEDNDWNVPSDQIWENIEAQLPPEKKRTRGFWLLFLPSAFLCVGLCAGLYFSFKSWTSVADAGPIGNSDDRALVAINPPTSTETDTERANNEPVHNATMAELKSSTRPNFENKTNQESATLEATTIVSTSKPTYRTTNDKNDKKRPTSTESQTPATTKKVETTTDMTENLTHKIIMPSQQSQQKANDEETTLTSETASKGNLPSDVMVGLLSYNIDMLAVPQIILKPAQQNKEFTRKQRHYFLNITSGTLILQPQNPGENYNFSFSTNLGLEYTLARHWTMEVGVQYLNLGQKLQYNINLPYNGLNESQHTDGNFDSKYTGQVNTSLGDVNMSMVLSRLASSSLSTGEAINLDVEGTEKIQLLQFPISVKYLFGKGKCVPFLKASYIPTLVLQSSVGFRTVSSNHPAVHHRATNAIITSDANFLSSLGATFGMHYQLIPSFALSTELYYQYLVTPFSKSQPTKPSLFGVNLGVRYAF